MVWRPTAQSRRWGGHGANPEGRGRGPLGVWPTGGVPPRDRFNAGVQPHAALPPAGGNWGGEGARPTPHLSPAAPGPDPAAGRRHAPRPRWATAPPASAPDGSPETHSRLSPDRPVGPGATPSGPAGRRETGRGLGKGGGDGRPGGAQAGGQAGSSRTNPFSLPWMPPSRPLRSLGNTGPLEINPQHCGPGLLGPSLPTSRDPPAPKWHGPDVPDLMTPLWQVPTPRAIIYGFATPDARVPASGLRLVGTVSRLESNFLSEIAKDKRKPVCL